MKRVVQPMRRAANEVFRLPPALLLARSRMVWFLLALLALTVASFASLDLRWGALLQGDAPARMARFLAELWPPNVEPAFLARLLPAAAETLAMSALGTLLAALGGLALALPASHRHAGDHAPWRAPTRWLLNALRSVPELVWATLLLIAAGLGPMAGTLALAMHTTGVLGRLYADALENAPPGPAENLRQRGVPDVLVLAYATLPLVAPQLLSYTLYRWENNIRAAAVLGVVGAGGLGQMMSYHLSLFQMAEVGSVLGAMLVLVMAVDTLSLMTRQAMSR